MCTTKLKLLAMAYKMSLKYNFCPDISAIDSDPDHCGWDNDEDELAAVAAMDAYCGLSPSEIAYRITEEILK